MKKNSFQARDLNRPRHPAALSRESSMSGIHGMVNKHAPYISSPQSQIAGELQHRSASERTASPMSPHSPRSPRNVHHSKNEIARMPLDSPRGPSESESS